MEALERGDLLHKAAEALREEGDQDEGGNDTIDGLDDCTHKLPLNCIQLQE